MIMVQMIPEADRDMVILGGLAFLMLLYGIIALLCNINRHYIMIVSKSKKSKFFIYAIYLLSATAIAASSLSLYHAIQ